MVNNVGTRRTCKDVEALMKEYDDVFDKGEHLTPMSVGPMIIKLVDGTKPTNVNGPRPIPFGWREKVKNKIDNLAR